MRILILILCLSFTFISCSGLGPLFHRPSSSGQSFTIQGIACDVAKRLQLEDGLVVGWEVYVARIVADVAAEVACKPQSQGGNAQHVIVWDNLPTESKQMQSITPFQRVTFIGDFAHANGSNGTGGGVLSGNGTTGNGNGYAVLIAKSVRLNGKR